MGTQQGTDILLVSIPLLLSYPTSITGAAYLTARFMRAQSYSAQFYIRTYRALRRISMDRFRNVLVDMRCDIYLPRLLLATSALNDYSWNYTVNL